MPLPLKQAVQQRENGTLVTYVAGVRIPATVKTGDKGADIAQSLADLINAKYDLPVTATVVPDSGGENADPTHADVKLSAKFLGAPADRYALQLLRSGNDTWRHCGHILRPIRRYQQQPGPVSLYRLWVICSSITGHTLLTNRPVAYQIDGCAGGRLTRRMVSRLPLSRHDG